MLPAEFYLLNTTTQLLWLFQTCSHEVLLVLILLGALFILVSFCISTFSLLKTSFRVVLRIVRLVLRIVFKFRDSSDSRTEFSRDLLQYSDNLLQHIISDSSSNPNPTPPLSNRLSLPQYLALHPSQWAAIEAAIQSVSDNTPQSASDPSFDFNTQAATNSSASLPLSPQPLRRSTRRRRVRNIINS